MLGDGLNSLIPPKGGDEPRGNIFPGSGPVPAPLGAHAPLPRTPIEPARELPPVPSEPELPPPPVAPDVPASPPMSVKAGIISAAPGKQMPAKRKPEERKLPEAVFHIEVSKVKPNPHQPRRAFGEEGLSELAASIREFGILQPIVVTKAHVETPTGTDVEYTLISGERRLMAAKKLGMETIPAIVRNVELDRERLELSIIENIQREDLNPIEVARAMGRLQDEFRLTQREIASRLGKSRETVANTVRLLDLPAEIQRTLEEGRITESHGRLLLAIDDPAARERLFRDMLERRMTVREVKERVSAEGGSASGGEAVSGRRRGRPRKEPLAPEIAAIKDHLTSELGAPVEIEEHGGSGKITIAFFSEEELRNIINRFGAGLS